MALSGLDFHRYATLQETVTPALNKKLVTTAATANHSCAMQAQLRTSYGVGFLARWNLMMFDSDQVVLRCYTRNYIWKLRGKCLCWEGQTEWVGLHVKLVLCSSYISALYPN